MRQARRHRYLQHRVHWARMRAQAAAHPTLGLQRRGSRGEARRRHTEERTSMTRACAACLFSVACHAGCHCRRVGTRRQLYYADTRGLEES